MDHCGILYNTYDSSTDTYTPAQLPLEEVRTRVWIVDVTARVTLIQKFYNSGSISTGRAKYCFPVPASAVVCAFQVSSSDGRVIRGECKEKDLAQEQYEAAMASGQMAGLLEYVTDDIFTISIGFIPPSTVVETHLTYAMTLYTGDYVDQVRFQLPSYVGQRYGIPPDGLVGSIQPARDRTRIAITADIQMSGRIQEVTSPTHPDIEETRYATHLGRSSRRRTTVRYHSDAYLDRDFVLVISAKDLDQPRCFVEVLKNPTRPDSLALQLTMVPKTKLPSIKSQRYLFVVDRSGSMSGSRIETAKRVLLMMLRMMPAHGSSFNIIGFDSTYELWRPTSQKYTEQTLREATKFVEGLQPRGGTEIRQALSAIFASSPPDMPTVVFVLTDGEATDVEGTKRDVVRFVQSSSTPRRVFTLGIGHEVSTDMCEGIARAGNGECLLAVDTESIVQKCVKLFTASRTPFVRGVTLNWGVNTPTGTMESPAVTFSNQPSPRSVATRPLPAIQQSPHTIGAIHSGTRMNVFAIVTLRNVKPPTEVVLSGMLDDEFNSPFEMKVPVQQISLVRSEDDRVPLLHTMAAWKLIQEYTESQSIPLPRALGVATDDELRQSVIVQLGVQYQIASQHTSFVAVEDARNTRTGRRLRDSFIRRHPEYTNDMLTPGSEESIHGPLAVARRQLEHAWAVMTSALAAVSTLWFNLHDDQGQLDPTLQPIQLPNNSTESVPGSFPATDEVDHDSNRRSSSSAEDDPTDYGSEMSERSSIDTLSTMSSLAGWSHASSSDWSSTYSDGSQGSYQRAPSPNFRHRQPEDANRTPRQRDSRNITSVLPTVVELVKLQEFDGSCPYGNMHALTPIVGVRAVEEAEKLSNAEREVWATVLCVAFLKKQLEHNPELLENILVKPLEYLRGKGHLEIDRLLERAAKLMY